MQCAERREFLRSGPYRWHLDKAQKAAIAETFANMKRAQCRLKLSVMEADASLRQMCTRAHLVTASRWRFPQAKAAMFSVSRRSVQSARESGPASKRAKCSV